MDMIQLRHIQKKVSFFDESMWRMKMLEKCLFALFFYINAIILIAAAAAAVVLLLSLTAESAGWGVMKF